MLSTADEQILQVALTAASTASKKTWAVAKDALLMVKK
jgi:hypothetical protein